MRTKVLVKKTALIITVLVALLLMSCNSVNTSGQYTYAPPENINDGLEAGSLKDVNIDEVMIARAVGRIQLGKYKEVHSMLIYKDGKLVLEEYFQGHKYKWDAPYYQGEWVQWNRTMKHQIMSCTKSVTSACIDLAIENGFIKNVNQSIFDYLPDHQQFNSGQKRNITIEHLLTMTSGLEWDEWHAPHATAANDIDRLYIECSEDPLACVLGKPLIHTPGESFTYNGGGMIMLGEILRNATGMDIVEFSKKYLFAPMGIDTTQWDRFPKGEVETAGGLHLTPRDMVKIGVTYLKDGVWKGERIVSANWVAKSETSYGNNSGIRLPIEDSGINGYGYTWWTSELKSKGRKIHMYRANGWGGQVIMVFPELDMVVVFTGGNYTVKSKLFDITKRFVLPAVIKQ
ncbi:MAG TPA: serine hydrolase [Bacteroidales bacterium]|nr:serine hydrolase [Bacteroidales bacterium]